jgi:putative ABC transport system ATP-binding protein
MNEAQPKFEQSRERRGKPNLEPVPETKVMEEATPVSINPQQKVPVLRAMGLSKKVTSPEGPLTILDHADLQIEQGETIAIVGASGAGKSTLLGLLAGLDVPSEGQVWVDGTELTALDEDGRAALRADRVGFVFQSFHLVPSLTALENVMLPLELSDATNPVQAARDALNTVGLEPRRRHYPHQLSGGEKQRVAIARAFVVKPSILFADEPTGNLDHKTGQQVVDLLFQLNSESGTTLVLVTHDLNLAARCQRIYYMEGGRFVDGPHDSGTVGPAAAHS